MGSVGDSYDNPLMENFFPTFKTELVYRQSWHSREEAENALFAYCDNLATHKTAAIHQWLARHPRFHALTTQMLQRSVHTSVQALERDIRDWIATWNAAPKSFVRVKTAEEILNPLARYLQRISGAGH
jgi:Integrase core domain